MLIANAANGCGGTRQSSHCVKSRKPMIRSGVSCCAVGIMIIRPRLRIHNGTSFYSHGRGRSMVHWAILRNIKVFIDGESCHDIDAKKRYEEVQLKQVGKGYRTQDKQRKQAAFYNQAVACKPIKSLCGDFQILKKLFGFKFRLFGTIQIKQAIQHNGHGRQGHESPYNIPIHIYGYDKQKREGHNARNPSQNIGTGIILKRIHDLVKYFFNNGHFHDSFPCKSYLIIPPLFIFPKQKRSLL